MTIFGKRKISPSFPLFRYFRFLPRALARVTLRQYRSVPAVRRTPADYMNFDR